MGTLFVLSLLAQYPGQQEYAPNELPAAVLNDEAWLKQRVEDLNTKLRLLDTDAPMAARVMLYLGYAVAPLIFLGLPATLLSVLLKASFPILVASISVLGVGVMGVGFFIVGILWSKQATGPAREEKEALTLERNQLEERLQTLRRARPPPSVERWAPPPMLVAAVF